MPNIFQASELMQDSPVEEAGMIKVRYMSLIKKIKMNFLHRLPVLFLHGLDWTIISIYIVISLISVAQSKQME